MTGGPLVEDCVSCDSFQSFLVERWAVVVEQCDLFVVGVDHQQYGNKSL